MPDGSLNFDTSIDTRGFEKGTNTLKNLGGAAVGAVGKSVAAIGAAAAASSAALVGFGKEAVNIGSVYENSLNKVASIADTSVKSIASISAEVKKLSMEMGTSAAGLNEAVYQAMSAGVDTAKAVDFVETASKAAAAGFTDTTTAVDGLTSVLNTYGMAAADAEKLANKFLVTQNLGKTSFGELAQTIGSVAPTAAAAGMSVDELLGSVASLTANGISTGSAMAGLKAAVSNIIKPTSEAAETAEKLGIDFSVTALQSKGWAAFCEDIATATNGDVDAMGKLFGSVEALNTMLTLTGGGAELFSKALDEMGTNTTALDDAYSTMTDSLSTSVSKLKASAEVLGTSFYDSISAPLKALVDDGNKYIKQLVDAFENGGLKEVSEAVGSLLADALNEVGSYAPEVVQTAADIIDSFLKGIDDNSDAAVDTVLEIVDIMISAIDGTGARFITTAADIITKLANGIISAFPELADTAVDLVSALAEGISKALPVLIPTALEAVVKICEGLSENIDKVVDAAGDIILGLVDGLTDERSLTAVIEAVPVVIDALVESFDNIMWKIIEVGQKIIINIADGLTNADWNSIMSDAFDKFKDIGQKFALHIMNGYKRGMEAYDFLMEQVEVPDNPLDAAFDSMGAPALFGGSSAYGVGFDPNIGKSPYAEYLKNQTDDITEQTEESSVVIKKSAEEIKADFNEWYTDLQYQLARGFIDDDTFKSRLKAKLESDSAYANSEYTAYWKQIQGVTKDTAKRVDEEFEGFYDNISYLKKLGAANGGITEDEYYSRLGDKLTSDVKYKAKEYADYWDEFNKYTSNQTEKAKDELKEAWVEVEHLNSLGIISDEDAYAQKLELIQKYCPEYSDEWYDYYKDIYDYQQKSEEQQLAASKASLNEMKADIRSGLDSIVSEYNNAYKEIQGKVGKYQQKLLSVGSTFDVKTETDSTTGTTTKTYSLNNIKQRLAAMKAFHANLTKLKDMGADPSLIAEIINLGAEDGAFFAEQLVKDSAFGDFNDIYKSMMDESKAMADEFYAGELEQINTKYGGQILEYYDRNMPDEFVAIGQKCGASFLESFSAAMTGDASGDMSGIFEASAKGFSDGASEQINSMAVSVDFSDIISTDDAYSSGQASGQAYMSGFNDAVSEKSIGMTTEASYSGASVKSGGSGNAVINTTVNMTALLDGEKIANVVTKYQSNSQMRSGT